MDWINRLWIGTGSVMLASAMNRLVCLFSGMTAPPLPQWATASSFPRFLDHTQRRTTVGRTPLDE